jgi:hypothetical protein
MKQMFIALAVLFIIGLTACNQKQNDNKTAELTNRTVSPIDGNWVTVSMEQNGKVSHPKRVPQQFKMFHDGYFSLVMYGDEGNFYLAGAGPYEIDGDIYKEKFPFHSDTAYIGCQTWQKWEMKGDTLIFYGFEKALMPDGKDVTSDWNAGGKFIEKRVRVKK